MSKNVCMQAIMEKRKDFKVICKDHRQVIDEIRIINTKSDRNLEIFFFKSNHYEVCLTSKKSNSINKNNPGLPFYHVHLRVYYMRGTMPKTMRLSEFLDKYDKYRIPPTSTTL